MTSQDLKQILSDHTKWLATDGKEGRCADLSGANLSGADLSDDNFRYADLSGANLSGADLSGANLGGAYLGRADLHGANLRAAILNGADLSGANFRYADLSGADLSGAYLGGANLSGAILVGAILNGADLSGANLLGANWDAIPVVEDLDRRMAQAVGDGSGLEMSEWHGSCGTVHCRAGWAVALAGWAGIALERRVGSSAAGALIYARSTPDHYIPDFFCDNETALTDINRRAKWSGRHADGGLDDPGSSINRVGVPNGDDEGSIRRA